MSKPPDQMLARIGANLRAERVRVGMKQEDLAYASELGTAQIARMERGEVDSGITKWVRVSHAIGVDVSTLFQGVERPQV